MKKSNNTEKKVFTTLDAYLSGFLVLKGFNPSLIPQDSGNKIIFAFHATEDLYKAITNYNTGAKVEADRLALAIKNLKSQNFSLRRRKENDDITHFIKRR
ncbi:MAG: hypothetical protein A2Z47_10605 [Thermodesulfovibrio sp. RBG_19FT_COMBO_42_12]|nr:MAG: hypothetical protein A2Z47_10605 [Thermodesulfovibrio sp. RBG_19FT_COMBO_42_12]